MNKRSIYLLAFAGLALAAVLLVGAGVAQAGIANVYVPFDGYSAGDRCAWAFQDAGVSAVGDNARVINQDLAGGDVPECLLGVVSAESLNSDYSVQALPPVDPGFLIVGSPDHTWNSLSFKYAAGLGGMFVIFTYNGQISDFYHIPFGQGSFHASTKFHAVFLASVRRAVIDNVKLSTRGGGEAETEPPVCPDDRINCFLYDDMFVLYGRTDDAGNPTIEVWNVNGDSQGELAFTLTEADFGDYLTNPPDSPVLVRSEGLYNVYVLPTGEIQINYGPNAEGKTFVIIMSGIDGGSPHGYVVEP